MQSIGVFLELSVDEIITRLKTVVRAKNDADLARKLGVDQSTVSSWRARGRVPKKFVDFANDDTAALMESEPQVWSELTDHAQSIALARFTLVMRNIASSGDADKAMRVFVDTTPFFLIMNRVVRELREKMAVANVDMKTAQALLLNNDLRDPDGTTLRIVSQLDEDYLDNPRLSRGNYKAQTDN